MRSGWLDNWLDEASDGVTAQEREGVSVPDCRRVHATPSGRAKTSELTLPACPLDRDHANVVVKLLSRSEAADLIDDGREKLVHR